MSTLRTANRRFATLRSLRIALTVGAVAALAVAFASPAGAGDDDPYAPPDPPPNERALSLQAGPACINDGAYITYSVQTIGFQPQSTNVKIEWLSIDGDVIATQTESSFSGTIPWPGMVFDSNGDPIDWPGWVEQGGTWVEADDGFQALRPQARVTFTVNPTSAVTVDYPPATPTCNPNPPGEAASAENEQNDDSLPFTGGDIAMLVAIGAGAVVVGWLLYAAGRRRGAAAN
jgi:hypothetical protein